MEREEEVENEIPKNNQNNTRRAKPSGENKQIEVCVEFGRAAFPFRSARQMVFQPLNEHLLIIALREE